MIFTIRWKPQKDLNRWHKWFAWRPVIVDSGKGYIRIAWFSYVLRRLAIGEADRWIYSEMRNRR
jgi:hypothetical protein